MKTDKSSESSYRRSWSEQISFIFVNKKKSMKRVWFGVYIVVSIHSLSPGVVGYYGQCCTSVNRTAMWQYFIFLFGYFIYYQLCHLIYQKCYHITWYVMTKIPYPIIQDFILLFSQLNLFSHTSPSCFSSTVCISASVHS